MAVLASAHDLPVKLREWRAEAERAEQVAASLNASGPAFQRAAQAKVGRADSEIVALLRAGDAELAAAITGLLRVAPAFTRAGAITVAVPSALVSDFSARCSLEI